MDLLDMKSTVLDKLKVEADAHNINISNVYKRISEALDIIIDANSKKKVMIDNGLQDMDEYNFQVDFDGNNPRFLLEIGTVYSPINIVRGGGAFMYKLLSLADMVNINTKRVAKDGAAGHSMVVIALTFNI